MSVHSDRSVGSNAERDHDVGDAPLATRRIEGPAHGWAARVRAAVDAEPGPVLLVGPAGADGEWLDDAPIVACLDGSPESAAVLPDALALARSQRRPLHLVAVLTPAATFTARRSGYDAERVLAHALALAAERIADPDEGADDGRRAPAHSGPDAPDVQWDVLHGPSVVEALLSHLDATGAAAVAVNSHAADTPRATVVDAAWISLLRQAPAPVLLTTVVPEPDPPPPVRRRRRPPPAMSAQPSGPRQTTGATPPVPPPSIDERLADRDERGRPRLTLRTHWPALLLVFLTAAVVLTVPTPYQSVRGELRSVEVIVDGTRVELDGDLRHPVVVTARESIVGAVVGWVDPDVAIGAPETLADEDLDASVEQVRAARRDAVAAAQALAAELAPDGAAAPDREVDASTGPTIGPSGGLAYALGVYAVLADADLLAGRTIVATGTIDADGTVSSVGAIGTKAAAARAAGADLFIVPCPNLAEAAASSPDLDVVCAVSLADAASILAGAD